MRTITASEFRKKCQTVFNEIHTTREPVLITKRGSPFLLLDSADEQPISQTSDSILDGIANIRVTDVQVRQSQQDGDLPLVRIK
jgi:PHD/YefM family antitoxin component YafN of YafNO toxin-antitoxin module